MDLDSIEALNEVRASVYRAALKLQSVQRLTHLHVVLVRHVTAALRSVDGARQLGPQEVTQILNRMFVNVSQEIPGHVTLEAPQETTCAIFTLFDQDGTNCVSVESLQAFLVALCADSLTEKYSALVSLAACGSGPRPGSVNRSSLRSLLHNLSLVPNHVQEEGVFGSIEAAVKSCFKGVLSPTISRDHVISWLHSEPRLLLWLPTVYRLSVSENVAHNVRCHCCKSRPFTGLRFRCVKCVNVHLCQTCFFTNHSSRKHKLHHPMIEFCSQPTFKESVSSLVQNARHALRFKRSRRTQLSVESPQNPSPRASLEDHTDISHDSPVSTAQQTDQALPSDRSDSAQQTDQVPPSDRSDTAQQTDQALPSDRSDTAQQTDQVPPSDRSDSAQQTDTMPDQSEKDTLKDELRTLQQDKCVLEEQLEALRLTVQSEHSVLEDKYSQVEVTVETLRRHHATLESIVSQALEKIESQHVNETTDEEDEENEETEDEEELKLLEADDEDDVTPPPTVVCGSPLSHDLYVEEEGLKPCSSPPTQQQEAEDCGSCSTCPEELLLDTVQRLKLALERDTWTKTVVSDSKWEELLEAAEEVGEEIHQLVDTII